MMAPVVDDEKGGFVDLAALQHGLKYRGARLDCKYFCAAQQSLGLLP
jgi:hypothetical protein